MGGRTTGRNEAGEDSCDLCLRHHSGAESQTASEIRNRIRITSGRVIGEIALSRRTSQPNKHGQIFFKNLKMN